MPRDKAKLPNTRTEFRPRTELIGDMIAAIGLR
jgi:hypothetical protein